jgi:hypothetical protein
MTANQAMAFIRARGVVLAAAKGPVPRMAEVIAGEPIKGSWWAHPKGNSIYAIFEKVQASPDVLVCRLVDGKVTFVHRRLWPALVRVANRFSADRLAQVHQEHTVAGHHVSRSVPFQKWVPADVADAASGLDESEALAALGEWAQACTAPRPRKKRPKK